MSSLSGAHDQASEGAQALARAVPDAAEARQAECLRRARDGDRAAYGQIVLDCQDRLYNAILRMVGDREEARELTQEAFTRGLEKLATFRGESAAYTWLFRIAVNLTISRLRKVHRHRIFSLERPAGSNGKAGDSAFGSDDQASALVNRLRDHRTPSPAEEAEHRERDREVLAALGRLDAEYRAVLVMRDIEGFDYQQMADILGLPLRTLKSRLFRARIALREQLKSYIA
jgi:RNA polymerase sigma-70 factor (ECF subfamily)